jgi:hypothetical protein
MLVFVPMRRQFKLPPALRLRQGPLLLQPNRLEPLLTLPVQLHWVLQELLVLWALWLLYK